jgi:AraC-like DNA-binding protein
MPKIDPKLPTALKRLGIVAWELPRAEIRTSPAHRHAEAQLCGLDAGLAVLETEAGAWTCPPGRCVWIPPNIEHSLRSCGKISGWMVRMEMTLEAKLPSKPRILALSPLLKEVILRMMTWVEDVTLDAQKQHLLDVFYDEVRSAPKARLHLPVPADPALKRLSLLLGETADGSTGLSELAREVGVSERSLFRKFQQETGLSPGQWRRQAKVLRSFELLTGGWSVTETATEVGYESVGAFIRAFREIAGLTPSQYAQETASTQPTPSSGFRR